MQYNISPDTIVDNRLDVSVTKLLNKEVDTSSLSEQNLSMAANGQCFTKEKQGFLPAMMEEIYEGRTYFKKKMIEKQKEYEVKIKI